MIPRLKTLYHKEIKTMLKEKYGFKNLNMAPKFEKVVLNMGLGIDGNDSKIFKSCEEDLAKIAGQKPVSTKFKKSISGHFKNYDANTDAQLFDALLHKYHVDQSNSEYLPAYFNGKIYTATEVFSKSYFANQENLEDLFNSSIKKIQKKIQIIDLS